MKVVCLVSRFSSFTVYILTFDSVPVYDARRIDFTFTEEELKTLDRLPRYTKELQEGSVVALGYTVGTFNHTGAEGDTGVGVTFYIQFVIYGGKVQVQDQSNFFSSAKGKEKAE